MKSIERKNIDLSLSEQEAVAGGVCFCYIYMYNIQSLVHEEITGQDVEDCMEKCCLCDNVLFFDYVSADGKIKTRKCRGLEHEEIWLYGLHCSKIAHK